MGIKGGRPKGLGGLNRDTLIKILEEVVFWDRPVSHESTALYYKIINIILDQIVVGVKRDGLVVIPGLGTFYAQKVKAKRIPVNFFKNQKVIGRDTVAFPASVRVKFRPCKSIRTDSELKENNKEESNGE